MIFNIEYPGISGLNLTVTDPESNIVTNLNFLKKLSTEQATIIYGTSHEGLKSFMIAHQSMLK